MDIQKIINKINIPALFKDLGRKGIFNLFKKIDSVIIIDISSKLTLISVELKDKVRVKALKRAELLGDKRNEIIRDVLTNFIQENDIKHKNIILNPCLKSLLIKRLQLPAVPRQELAEAIKWQLKDEVSFDMSKAVLDFSIVKKTTKDDGAKILDIMCVLAEEDEIIEQILPLKQLGFSCLAVIPLVFSYTRLIGKYYQVAGDEAIGILNISEGKSYISIYKNKKLELYRELPVSIDRLKEALTEALVTEQGKIKLSKEEAKELLFELGVPDGSSSYKGKVSSAQILAMLRPILELLVQETKRSLVYYNSEIEISNIKRIVIGGQGAKIPRLNTFLTKELSLEVENISLEDVVSISSSVDVKAFPGGLESVGLALDYKDNINILPYEFRSEKIEKFQRVSLGWVTFVAAALLLVSYIFAQAKISAYEKRLENSSFHLNVISELRDTKIKFDVLNNFMSGLKRSEPNLLKLFKTLSSISDKSLFLKELSLDCNTGIGKMKGFAKSSEEDPYNLLTRFVQNIQGVKYFGEVNISSVQKRTEKNFDIAEFDITFTVN